MRHYAAHLIDARWQLNGPDEYSARTSDLLTHIQLLMGAMGREHLTVWVATHAQLDELLRLHFLDVDGDPIRVDGKWCQPRMGSDGSIISARWGGRCWFRSAELWVKPARFEEADTVSRRIESLRESLASCAVPMKGTPGSSAVEGWRLSEGAGRWNWCTWVGGDDTTATMDWMRRALYGGRCELLGENLYYAKGSANEWPELCCPPHGEFVELPEGARIWVLDLRTAYPAAMARPLPDVWAGARQHGALNLDQHGIAEVTVELNGSAKALPVRTTVQGVLRTLWPTRGTYRGVWTATHLWAATRGGTGRIVKTHRLIQWPKTTTILRPYIARLLKSVERADGWEKKAMKGVARALYGRFAQSRAHWELVDVAELLRQNELTPGDAPYVVVNGRSILRVAGIWGPWALCSVLEDHYPKSANPAWATEVTAVCVAALARAEHLTRAAGMTPLYCDTDGIHVAGTRDQLDESGVRIGSGPGQWRIEGCCTWAAYYAPRVYTTSDPKIRAAAGVPRAERETLLRRGWQKAIRLATIRESMSDSAVTPGTRIPVTYTLRR